ncbi:MAG: endonuclease/exonuclease/phosphatase family protein [Cytophagaceae bacterium]|nr:endonuclease/exonuclease/phosphatase family protein [Cytophagaceae bacterium]
MKSKFTAFLSVFVAIASLGVYLLPDLKPVEYPLVSLGVLLIPVLLIIQVVFIIIWLFRQPRWMALVPFCSLLIGIKYIDRSFSFSVPSQGQAELNVLSCNVRIFNVYDHLRDKNYESTNGMINWVRNHPADVACLQEYYNSPNKNFQSERRIKEKFKYSFATPFLEIKNQQFGMAIFSKHPIVNKGELQFREKSNNQVIFADIRLSPSKIIRVYNIHLQSMAIDDAQLANTAMSSSYFDKVIKSLVRYKNGCIQRSRQVDALTRHIAKCPYPVVVCGDLNEPPYGYVYEQLSEVLDNTFQQAGNGFGVTYHGKIPLLRIDNIFTSKESTVHQFTIHNENLYSDHYPISAQLSF